MKERWTVKAGVKRTKFPKALLGSQAKKRFQQELSKQASVEYFTQINFHRISVQGIQAFALK